MAEHGHAHSHDHDHEGDSYFIDQLCMVGLSGAFGVVCLCLWFWQTAMLDLMLGPQFHLYVLLSGIVLTVLAVTRSAILWRQSRDAAFLKTHDHDHHDHDHGHDHKHDHAHEHAVQEKSPHAVQSLPLHTHSDSCGHDHGPGESCGHEHHAHAHHGHAHADHDEADHDHGWAPWRYVVILVPIILFLLGLPNKPPSLVAREHSVVGLSPDVETNLQVLGLGTDTLSQLTYVGVAFNMPSSGKGEPRNFKDLETMASTPDLQATWKNKVVEVRGQYSPIAGSDQLFMLVRLKISCCANDAVQLDVPMASREPITGISRNDWVKVTGRVEFRRDKSGSAKTVLIIAKASDVVKCEPDANPYIQ